MIACDRPETSPGSAAGDASAVKPTISASPIVDDKGQWKIINADYVTLTVKAPAAHRARIFYRPVAAGGGYVEVQTFFAPSRVAGGFSSRGRAPAYFSGGSLAETRYT